MFLIFIFIIVMSSAEKTPSEDPHFKACEPKDWKWYRFQIHGQQSHCVYPGFKLTCKDSKPVLNVPLDNFNVHDIFYENQSLSVANSISFDETCPSSIHNLTFQRTPFNISHANHRLFFFNCTASLHEEQYEFPISCVSNKTHHSFAAFADYEVLNSTDISETCESLVIAPVAVVDIEGFHANLTLCDCRAFLKDGFLLEWSANNCSKCIESGGRCGFYESTSDIVCLI